jgi:Flp pilus assembly protein TadB
MTTRPHSVRANHQRVVRRSLIAGLGSIALLMAGAAVVAFTRAWWSWAILLVGLAAVVAFFGILPRWVVARAQLRQVERIKHEQTAAAQAQLQARQRGLAAPAIRSPFASNV